MTAATHAPAFKHIAGGVYALPGYAVVSEADQAFMLDVLGDEITSAFRIGKVAHASHAAANDLLAARIECARWGREYTAFIASKRGH
jgi:hypothetical protein